MISPENGLFQDKTGPGVLTVTTEITSKILSCKYVFDQGILWRYTQQALFRAKTQTDAYCSFNLAKSVQCKNKITKQLKLNTIAAYISFKGKMCLTILLEI